jgi:mRNA interferase MazF
VIQSDQLNVSSRVIVALLTSDLSDIPATRPVISANRQNGLEKTSELMTDILVTLPRSKIGRTIGELSQADLRRAEISLLYTLGFS